MSEGAKAKPPGTSGWFVPEGEEALHQRLSAEGGIIQGAHLKRALEYVRGWDLAVDGGAHIGTWTVPLTTRFKRVWAFETGIRQLDALLRNLVNRGLYDDHVVICWAALGERAMGAMPVKVPGGSLGDYVAAYKDGPLLTLPLDALNLSPDFIKLDLEGSECWALRGMRATIQRAKPTMLIEWKPYKMGLNGGSAEQAHELLADCGLRHLDSVGQDRIYGP